MAIFEAEYECSMNVSLLDLEPHLGQIFVTWPLIVRNLPADPFCVFMLQDNYSLGFNILCVSEGHALLQTLFIDYNLRDWRYVASFAILDKL